MIKSLHADVFIVTVPTPIDESKIILTFDK